MNIQDLIRPSIKGLRPYSSARDEFRSIQEAMIFLDANESPFANDINRYPDPQQMALKISLSKIKDIATENMLLGNGSDEVLDLIIRAFCEPKVDNVIILPPTYGMYQVLANVNNVNLIQVPLSNDFQPVTDQILKTANGNSKLLFLCSPNNPTANSLDRKLVEELIINFKGIVIIDEAYIDFSKGKSWLSRLNEFPNLIITQTLSKAYGMAGIRLGICYASVEIIAVLNKIKPPYNVNELTQQKALENLSDNTKYKLQLKEIISERDKLMTKLESVPLIQMVYSSDANFVLIKVDNAHKRYKQLLQEGIVVRNRTNVLGCENCIRITVGTSQENKKLINTLKKLV